MDPIDIRSKGEIIKYLQKRIEESKTMQCSHLKIIEKILEDKEEETPITCHYPECNLKLASLETAGNIKIDMFPIYGNKINYNWPICPADCPRYEHTTDLIGSLLDENNEEIDTLVTLDQAAAIVQLSKRTLEKYKSKGIIPKPDIIGSGGTANKWMWNKIRPSLQEISRVNLPKRFPASSIIPTDEHNDQKDHTNQIEP